MPWHRVVFPFLFATFARFCSLFLFCSQESWLICLGTSFVPRHDSGATVYFTIHFNLLIHYQVAWKWESDG